MLSKSKGTEEDSKIHPSKLSLEEYMASRRKIRRRKYTNLDLEAMCTLECLETEAQKLASMPKASEENEDHCGDSDACSGLRHYETSSDSSLQ